MNQNYNNAVGNNMETDVGLRNFMLGTYRYMAMAMGVTAIVAYFGGQAIQSNPQDIIINVVALGAIAMITAWETQMLKRVYYGNAGNPAMSNKLAAFGAASLLLAFINMFQILLSLFGRE